MPDLRKLFDDPDVWQAFVAEKDRRDQEWRAQHLVELERAARAPGATIEDIARYSGARAVQRFFAERNESDGIGTPVGTA